MNVPVASSCTHPRGLALGHFKQSNGKALGHRSLPCPRAEKASRGRALGHRKHVPPGQARKAEKPHSESDEHGDENSSGQGDESSSGHGNAKGHDNGHGNGDKHGDEKEHGNGNGNSSHGRGNKD